TKIAFVAVSDYAPGDANGQSDIYVKDLLTGGVACVSTAAGGAFGDSESFNPVLSPDRTRIAFVSRADNLVASDTNNALDVFIKDLATGGVTRATTSAAGVQQAAGFDVGPLTTAHPVFSPDGRYVAFTSTGTGLVPATPPAGPIFPTINSYVK